MTPGSRRVIEGEDDVDGHVRQTHGRPGQAHFKMEDETKITTESTPLDNITRRIIPPPVSTIMDLDKISIESDSVESVKGIKNRNKVHYQ